MPPSVSVHEAKTHLSRLLEEVRRGRSIVITRSGDPVAKLVPLSGEPRRAGRLKGKLRIAADFDAPLPPEMGRLFRGESD